MLNIFLSYYREAVYMENNNIPEKYRPISMWGYFGYEILFSIPVIGFIFLIIFAIGSKNVNKKNFARSYFCFLIIIGLIALVTYAIAMFTGAIDALIN